MRQRALQVPPYPRNMAQVLRFAVATIQTREDAEHLGCALRGERRVELREGAGFEARIIGLPRTHVAAQQQQFERLGHIDARILEQRGDIVGRGTKTAS